MSIKIFKRFAIMFYDALLVLALLVVFSMVADLLMFVKIKVIYQFFLFIVVISYFVGFWRFGQATTGMLAWKCIIVDFNGNPPTMKQLMGRFFASCLCWFLLGAGFLVSLINKNNFALNDIISRTYIKEKK
jgi:uncharacterized RDD family membrane protein YckC